MFVDADQFSLPDRLEKQVAPFTQRSEDVLQQLDVVIKTGEQLEQESHDRIRQAAIAAYSALDEATADLLRVQRGTARLSRVDPAIITKLNLATARFVELHSVGDTNAWKLGKDSAALMSFGDSTKTFRLTLQSEHAKLTQQLTDHSAARDRHKSHLSTLKSEESTIRSRRTRAVDDSENGWNQVAFFFKPSARDNLQTIISDADAGLERNRAAQRAADNKIRVLYLLDTLIGWATRALDVVSAAVARVAQDFQAKFARVVGAQQVSDRLFAGLLGMANVVRDGEFGSSRDNSLRVVLEVLRRFHGLRADHAALEIPGIGERRIQRAICEGLGEEGVRRLMEPPEAVEEGEEGVNSL